MKLIIDSMKLISAYVDAHVNHLSNLSDLCKTCKSIYEDCNCYLD